MSRDHRMDQLERRLDRFGRRVRDEEAPLRAMSDRELIVYARAFACTPGLEQQTADLLRQVDEFEEIVRQQEEIQGRQAARAARAEGQAETERGLV